jgi:L-asparaginase/Glu-tRNA(Gln) amidotransferase subunit D
VRTAAAGVLPPQKARLYLQLLLTVTRDMDEIRAAFREY